MRDHAVYPITLHPKLFIAHEISVKYSYKKEVGFMHLVIGYFDDVRVKKRRTELRSSHYLVIESSFSIVNLTIIAITVFSDDYRWIIVMHLYILQ